MLAPLLLVLALADVGSLLSNGLSHPTSLRPPRADGAPASRGGEPQVVGGLEEALDRREGPAPTADSADPLLGPAGYLAVSLVASLLSGALWVQRRFAAAAPSLREVELGTPFTGALQQDAGALQPAALQPAAFLVEPRADSANAALALRGGAKDESRPTPKAFLNSKPLVSSAKQYDEMWKESVENPEAFWGRIAQEFTWKTPYKSVLGAKNNFDVRKGPINISWFDGGVTNICYNALDRHVEAGNGDKVAFYWEGNDVGEDSKMTYSEVLESVSRLANHLRAQGVKKGDVVQVYMPMVCELPIAMLACARIGAVHSVVFGGFSSEALAQRIAASDSKVLLTCSAVKRGGKTIGLKQIADDAMELAKKAGKPIKHCLVFDNERAMARADCSLTAGRDAWWQDAVAKQSTSCPVEWVDSEAPLFLLYTSGSTGQPKGILHTTGGYMIYSATTFKYTFDWNEEQQKNGVFWCTADCGWITGHSYIAYGPMLNGASQVIFEGVPSYPDAGRCWDVVDKYKVSAFYTAPTAIRALMREGDSFVKRTSRKSLRILGTVGEPINPEAWRWYADVVGNGKCPIVDTWWQTETAGHAIVNLPGVSPQVPGSAQRPFFGCEPVILDEKGNELSGACEGMLCIKSPWPSTMRTVFGDQKRFETAYFAPFEGYYFSGDGARRDADGNLWITGRVDDVLNVSGHRIGTAEVESALVLHPKCSEAAVIGVEHPVKGQAIYAFVTLMEGVEPSEELRQELRGMPRKQIGPFAGPDTIQWAPGLPKTRSGKIMRRILRKVASGESDFGDTSTLADPGVVDELVATKPK